MEKLKIEYVDINSIKPYEKNAKLHPEEQIEQIKKINTTVWYGRPYWNMER